MTTTEVAAVLAATATRTDDGRTWLTTADASYARLNDRWHRRTDTGTVVVSDRYIRRLLTRRYLMVTK
jgi:hypothetical protein